MKDLGRNQRLFLESLCARSPGDVMTGSWDVATTERIGMSLAKRGLVDGPTEPPKSGYASHTINDAGRQWVHDNVGPISGWRRVLTGEELPHDEYRAYIDECADRLRGQIRKAANAIKGD
jgi:hypothetical protein